MTPRRLWRLLPLPFRAGAWRALDRLGAWPVRLAAGPARGLSLLAPASRRRGYRAGRHEPLVLELLAERLGPGMEFVDVGAFLGYFTLAAAVRVGPEGRVWAFEPRAANRRLIERSVRRNRLTQVSVSGLALGASPGRASLTRPPNPSMGRLLAAGEQARGATPIAVTTLDAWCAESGARPSLIKIDVEGGELGVLAGSAETLRRYRPLLLVEAHCGRHLSASPARLVEWLGAAGYRVAPLAGGLPGELAASLERLTRLSPPRQDVAVLHLLATPGRDG